jgi:hypothetical protein
MLSGIWGVCSSATTDAPQKPERKNRKIVKEVKRSVRSSPGGKNVNVPVHDKTKRLPLGVETFDELEEMMNGLE